MASSFRIQKPYVLDALPRPLDPATGRYVVSKVYGSTPGSRKRKRYELAVGIDGEAVNIYNVSSFRLITSYPLPPQSSFSCPASSIRHKAEGTQEVSRYTYAATRESHNHKITLFKDRMDASGSTHSTSQSVSLDPGQPAVYVTPITTLAGSHASGEGVLVVRADGTAVCMDAETLQERWKSTSAVLQQDLPETSKANLRIDFCCSAPLSEVAQAVFKGYDNTTNLQPDFARGRDVDAEVLILISASGSGRQQTRHVHIVAMPLPSHESSRGVVQLYVMPIPSPSSAEQDDDSSTVSYHLDLQSGSLIQLRDQTFSVYDLTSGLPKLTSSVELTGVTSFLRLSKTSLLYSTSNRLGIYNPVYRSIQNSIPVDLDDQDVSIPSSRPAVACLLAAYFPRLELAVAVVDSSLVAIQLEAPILRIKKRRAEGLLIDSIGRGVQPTKRSSARVPNATIKTSIFTNYLPGSIRGNYWESWIADEAAADSLLSANDISGLETLLAKQFGIQIQDNAQALHGANGEGSAQHKASPIWIWPKTRAGYPPADRRWILYAIRRAFRWNDALPEDSYIPRLICQLPQSSIVKYLVGAGHLTLSNIKSALRGQLGDIETSDSVLADQIIHGLVEADPSLKLIVDYVSATNVGVVELLVVLRTIMRRFEQVKEPARAPPKLLIEEPTTEKAIVNGEWTMAESREILTGHGAIGKPAWPVSQDADVHSVTISIVLTKLSSCPSASAVKALRATFKLEEILSLVNLLSDELVRGSWTSSYLDSATDTTLHAPPNSIVKLIADLLGRCIDSIGPDSWLNDAALVGDDFGNLIASLKLEVSAALEGLEAASYLSNMMGDIIKYSKEASKARPESTTGKAKPTTLLHEKESGSQALPAGLKTGNRMPTRKVAVDGEIVNMSLREIAYRGNQQDGCYYSLERITI
ncbi:hypothetical protein GGS23DRAFT_599377 [Durotheca rogersii]|uniref:uncharacterized protein n=1 Tax=Durotheca rogersii TaxID=419775 RepID=UPI0022210A34|nr:uncharacterized protein GGS23DRAFT_599377 [Durotheca rogersii]KAI5860568.1 hypothetical protein GGS23DRAFT_599377 [Durotheca rogersii]